ncbi:hypothetical protein HHK36_011927 [Tetracentron sinense]|uniref:Protein DETOXIFICATION n=1 Tax=Tetracentron sinense TaxID=13715 RepID=A0A834ZHA9_TETSI|nr:hypothetical protein HHK36_011927 [Tetracentron sinense]
MAEDGGLCSSENKRKVPFCVFFKDIRLVFKMDELGLEIARIAFPAAMALAADPIASLIDTAFIGHIGPVELAAVGVSIAVFNQVSRIAIFPLVSVTTSFVAEEDAAGKARADAIESENFEKCSSINSEMKGLIPQDSNGTTCTSASTSCVTTSFDAEEDAVGRLSSEGKESGILENDSVINDKMKELILQVDSNETAHKLTSVTGGKSNMAKFQHEKKNIPSASSALVIGGVLGLVQAILLIFAAKPLLNFMGVKSDSSMITPARRYLTLRALGSPAVLLSLAMQGVFRGIKDTKTPLYATVAGDLTNIILDPILIFACHMGVSGAAIAHVISQYLISLILLWRLVKRVNLLPPSVKDLQFSRFLKNGFLLLARVIAVTFCVTLAASMAARHGATSMAAFQVCLQIWLTTSLLADGLAVAGQAILAGAFVLKDYDRAIVATARVSQLGVVLGLGLSIVLGVGMQFGSRMFTKDINVLNLIKIGIPFVAATQPINAIAFVFDGVNFGASDYAFSAYSMASL